MASGNKKVWLISQWHKIKIAIQLTTDQGNLYFREKEIWWASIGSNLGHEEDGKNQKFERPVLILKKFNEHLILIVPLTSKVKEHSKYYFKFKLNNRASSVIISQIRIISSKRLIRKIDNLNNRNFYQIKRLVKGLI